jgi:hypothetical protein
MCIWQKFEHLLVQLGGDWRGPVQDKTDIFADVVVLNSWVLLVERNNKPHRLAKKDTIVQPCKEELPSVEPVYGWDE